jgi:predicted RNA binding protein YcfA (HicA-like mRNA interferase family)
VKWKPYQDRLVTLAEMKRWEHLFANGVGFITGAVSGIIVIESDGLAGQTVLNEFEAEFGPLPKTLVIRSGSGRGFHRHFKHPGYRVTTVANTSIKLDVKGDGGFCVLPPSKHKHGGRYEVVCDAPIADLPPSLLTFIERKAHASKPGMAWPAAIMAADDELAGTRAGPMAGSRSATSRPPPVNRTNAAIIQTMLDALPDAFATEENLWFRVGLALHHFNTGAVGLALWRKFSMRCPHKAALTDFEKRWNYFDRDYEGRPITIGWLWAQAAAHGWLAPCRWDRSTRDKFEGSRYDQR